MPYRRLKTLQAAFNRPTLSPSIDQQGNSIRSTTSVMLGSLRLTASAHRIYSRICVREYERAERLLTTEDLKFGSPTAENIKSAQSMGLTEFQPDYCLCPDFSPSGRATNAPSASHVA